VSSGDRKRADRRKRKERSASRPVGPATTGGDDDAQPPSPTPGGGDDSVMDLAAEAEARGISKSELRNERAREELEPLDRGERPLVVTIGAAISLLIAASIIIAWLAGVEVQVGNTDIDERPSAFQVFPPAILFTVMGVGMLGARYWAVLGFQAIMAIIMIGAFLTLIAATTIFQALSTLVVLLGAGALFWFTIKALARIQMPEPGGRDR
jgi:hypothetical protein